MNMHYMFHTNAALVRALDATEEEKEKYQQHLDQCSRTSSKEMKFVDYLLKLRDSKGQLENMRNSRMD